MWTVNFQMFKLLLDKGEQPEIKFPTSVGSSKKQESSRKTSTSSLLTMRKPLTVWVTINCRKLWKRWAYQTTWPASWEICMQVRKKQLELDMEQQTASKFHDCSLSAQESHFFRVPGVWEPWQRIFHPDMIYLWGSVHRSQSTVENSERDGNTRPPDLPLEKSVCRSGRNSYNWTWNNRLVPKRKRSTSRLYIVTLFI